MIVGDNYKGINKIQLLIDLVRADEALATLIENEYDFADYSSNTIELLDDLGIECEIKYNKDTGHTKEGLSIFNEFDAIINGLAKEIKNKDFIIHKNHCYGYNI